MNKQDKAFVIGLAFGLLIGATLCHALTWPHAYKAGLQHAAEMTQEEKP